MLLAVARRSRSLPPQRVNAIQPELVAESRAIPGRSVDLAIVMHTAPGLARLLAQPRRCRLADAGRMDVPPGAQRRAVALSGAERLIVAGLMNYVYERDHAILVRLDVPADATRADRRRAPAQLARLHRQGLRSRTGRGLARPAGRRIGAARHALRRVAPRPAASARQRRRVRRQAATGSRSRCRFPPA